MKRYSIFLVATLLFATQSVAFITGKCGPNVSYIINDAGDKVIITGSGPMYDYESPQSPFSNNTLIKEIEVREGVTTLGNYIFYSCGMLESITLPSTLTIIGEGALLHCSALRKLDIPESVVRIGAHSLQRTGLRQIRIPKGVTTIDDYTFAGCFDLEKIILPEGLTSIGEYAINTCINLKEINIPNTVATIEDDAFYACKKLEKITLPKSLKVINENLFRDCFNLQEVTISENVEEIRKAFSGCIELKANYAKPLAPPTVTNNGLADVDKHKCALYVPMKPASSLQRYISTEPWSDFYLIDTFNSDAPRTNKYDVNEDGFVNAADVVSIYNHIITGE